MLHLVRIDERLHEHDQTVETVGEDSVVHDRAVGERIARARIIRIAQPTYMAASMNK